MNILSYDLLSSSGSLSASSDRCLTSAHSGVPLTYCYEGFVGRHFRPSSTTGLVTGLLPTNLMASGIKSGSVSPFSWPVPGSELGQRWLSELPVGAGNQVCADCNRPEASWASCNLGITLCVDCAGAHRSLGIEFSQNYSG
ncbi:unnamed protein product [Protopolystoma xenopodis]|uniref:Arf-GAP domain-containing protein n=1 Tax=Protopolystoma xenopodis TaxID=117903 RepID=A0A448WRL3_9PLAT|nr:unnamed protein product [Protopolystoma xenopodis]